MTSTTQIPVERTFINNIQYNLHRESSGYVHTCSHLRLEYHKRHTCGRELIPSLSSLGPREHDIDLTLIGLHHSLMLAPGGDLLLSVCVHTYYLQEQSLPEHKSMSMQHKFPGHWLSLLHPFHGREDGYTQQQPSSAGTGVFRISLPLAAVRLVVVEVMTYNHLFVFSTYNLVLRSS